MRLQVADLGRSLAFYEQVLGLHVAGRGAAHVTLAAQPEGAGGEARTLVELVERPGARPTGKVFHAANAAAPSYAAASSASAHATSASRSSSSRSA